MKSHCLSFLLLPRELGCFIITVFFRKQIVPVISFLGTQCRIAKCEKSNGVFVECTGVYHLGKETKLQPQRGNLSLYLDHYTQLRASAVMYMIFW